MRLIDAQVPAGALLHHLEGSHGRSAHELGVAALSAVHRLEHLDDELGLLSLDHTHEP